MNRRFFLSTVAAAAATAAFDEERGLWVRKKLISIPRPVPVPDAGCVLVQEWYSSRTGGLLGVKLIQNMTLDEYRRRYPRGEPRENMTLYPSLDAAVDHWLKAGGAAVYRLEERARA